MSVSVPFCTASEQVGATQAPPTHDDDVQSVPATQPCPTGHAGHEPPQSTSVSEPFCTTSEHVGSAHDPPTQDDVTQSPPAAHP